MIPPYRGSFWWFVGRVLGFRVDARGEDAALVRRPWWLPMRVLDEAVRKIAADAAVRGDGDLRIVARGHRWVRLERVPAGWEGSE